MQKFQKGENWDEKGGQRVWGQAGMHGSWIPQKMVNKDFELKGKKEQAL